MTIVFIAFVGLLALGVPVVFVLGASALLALVTTTEVPVTIVSQRVFAGLNSFTLMAIPFFVFAGVIMDAGGISRRIVDFASALIGWVTGSLLLVSCVAAAGLAAISGSGSADTAAISSIMQPQLRRRRYDVDFGAAIIACAGSLAQVIPPSLTMVVVAVIANMSIGALFLSGVVPGLLCIGTLMIASYIHARNGRSAISRIRTVHADAPLDDRHRGDPRLRHAGADPLAAFSAVCSRRPKPPPFPASTACLSVFSSIAS